MSRSVGSTDDVTFQHKARRAAVYNCLEFACCSSCCSLKIQARDSGRPLSSKRCVKIEYNLKASRRGSASNACGGAASLPSEASEIYEACPLQLERTRRADHDEQLLTSASKVAGPVVKLLPKTNAATSSSIREQDVRATGL